MGIVNLLGPFDEISSKAKIMIICTTIISFMEFCIDEKIEPKIDELVKYVKEKTGISIDNVLATQFLNIMTGNIKVFIMFMINEQCEKISDNMLDTSSNMFGFIRRSI